MGLEVRLATLFWISVYCFGKAMLHCSSDRPRLSPSRLASKIHSAVVTPCLSLVGGFLAGWKRVAVMDSLLGALRAHFELDWSVKNIASKPYKARACKKMP